MNRKDFIKLLALTPVGLSAMNLNELNKVGDNFTNSPTMPILFLGHGSPMNAIEINEFTNGFKKLSQEFPKPNAIICISAHWETKGTFITAMDKPKTIHDFGGFPPELYAVEYPAAGNPELAKEVKNMAQKTQIELDHEWGLDHGTWSVVKHIFPNTDVPVLQLSIDYTKSPEYLYNLAGELQKLRDKGVLIIGSGNIVHNLRRVAWSKLNEDNYGFDWAFEANELSKKLVNEGNHKELINFSNLGSAADLAIPTPEHFLPLLYILGLKKKSDNIEIFNDKAVGGSLTMTSFKFYSN